MTFDKHGLSVDLERTGDSFFLTIKAIGKLTHKDYEKITATLDASIKDVEKPELNILLDGSEFEGWELRAAWDDIKLGLDHGKEFKKIAIYGNKKWLEISAKVGAWFVSGDVRYFDDLDDATNWFST